MSTKRHQILFPAGARGVLALLTLGVMPGLGGCRDAAEPQKGHDPPAEIENRTTEQDLTTVRLSPAAEARIGIQLGEVESKPLTRTRQLGGELLVAPGSSATVTAPKAAVVLAPDGAEIPGVGALVRKNEALLRLVVLPAEGSLAGAREELAVAEARLANAEARALLGEEFLPRFKEYDFLMHWVEKPGTSIEAMNRITLQASRELRAIPGVRNFGSHTGRAEVADEVVGPNFTELWISLDPSVDYEDTVGEIQAVVDGYPGLYRDLLTYLRERIKEVLSGVSATLVVRIFGPDLDRLETIAHDVERAITGVDGVVDLHVQPQVRVPQIEVRLRPEVAAQFGLTPGHVQRALATLVKGTKVSEFYEGQGVFDITVWGLERVRSDPAALRRIMLDTPSGGQVPLGDVADVHIVGMRNEITREQASRKIDVTCNVVGRDLGSVARDIEATVAGLDFEAAYHPEIIGEFAEQEATRNRLLGLAVLSLVAIFLILHADFGSGRLGFLVLLTVPFAAVGGLVAVVLTGATLSLGSLVGFVTVLGIAVRNSIMLISHYRHLETEEGVAFGPALILRGSEERLAPILMTSLATGLALLPIVAGGVRPGWEIEHPMAVVITGGLLTSTLLNLLLLPALYLRFAPSAVVPHDEES